MSEEKALTKDEFIKKWKECDWGEELISDLNALLREELIKFEMWCEKTDPTFRDDQYSIDVVNEYLKSQQQ
jgi:hypothetical protein